MGTTPPAKPESKSPLEYTWSYWTLQSAQGIYRRLFDFGFAGDIVPTVLLSPLCRVPCALLREQFLPILEIVCAIVFPLLLTPPFPFFRVGYLQDLVLAFEHGLVLLVPPMLVLETLLPVFPVIRLFLGVGHAPRYPERDPPSIFFQTQICTRHSRTKDATPRGGVFDCLKS